MVIVILSGKPSFICNNMLNSEGFYEKLLEGWDTEQTTNGIPYFINHQSEKTQWDHPFYLKTIDELGDFDNIKYAAYRTAMKVRFLQKRYCFDLVDTRLLTTTFDRNNLDGPCTGSMDYSTIENVVQDLIEACYKPESLTIASNRNPQVMTELLLNWLMDLYDSARCGEIRISSVKVALVTLSSARLTEKYKYIFKQIMNKNNRVDRVRMQQFLQDLVKITDILQESSSFGGLNVRPAVDSCFAQAWSGTLGVNEDEFIAWLMKEPQTIVWLPTMHRLAAAETVNHESKCNICKAFPITGLRYKCLKCFNFDMCQQCFLTGRVSKNHKIKHPTQEYCLSTSTKEDTKALLRTIRNNFSKKHRNKRKLRYLPIQNNGNSNEEGIPDPPVTREHSLSSANTLPIRPVLQQPLTQGIGSSAGALDIDERRELANIILHLEQENRELMQQLEHSNSHPASMQSPVSSDGEGSDPSDWIEKDKLDAKQEVLEAHNKQLQLQLTRLRMLLHRDDLTGEEFHTLQPLSVNIPHHMSSNNPDYSDPLSQKYYHTLDNERLNANQSNLITYTQDSYVNTPVGRRRPRSCTPKLTSSSNHTPRIDQSYNTPDSFSRYGIDTTIGSEDLTLGRTHFSLPSPPELKHYPEEEAELAELVAKINDATPLDVTREELVSHEGAMGEMLRAANQIGEAFSGLVTNGRQSKIDELEQDYESQA